jgi:hypothetical protein
MQVRALKLQDVRYGNQWFDEVEDHWDYEDFPNHPEWRDGWVSMDCALYNPDDDRVYLGITSFAADIFKAYDRRSEQFVDLGYARIADPFDAKFHRSLVKGKDGCLYAAQALLHDVDRHWQAPGASIVRYDPRSGAIAKLGIPVPHTYIQAIALDDGRQRLYCLCFPPEKLALFDLGTGVSRDLGLIGTYGGMVQGENIVLDDAGCVWCNWSLTRAWQSAAGADALRLCKFDPRQDCIVFSKRGLPRLDGSHGTVKAEAFFNLGDGFIYASGANGSLYRVDPESFQAHLLFTPTPERRSRLSSLAKGEDGAAYGVTGRDGQCEFMRVDYRRGTFEKLGPLRDEAGNALWQNHDIVAAGEGVFYVCENDNPYRSSYLWEVTL